MQKIQIRRAKNLWIPLKGNFCTPCAVWELDLGQLETLIEIDVRKQIASCLLKPKDLDQKISLKITDLLALTAAKLQSCDSDEVFTWLMDVNCRHSEQNFCYSFLDEKVAARVGPLTVDFLLKSNALWISEAGDKSSANGIVNLLSLYVKQVERIGYQRSNLLLLIEAKQRDIPTRRHSDRPTYQLGYGSQRKIVSGGYTNMTSQLATVIATHKYLAANLLRECGLPAPRHVLAKTIEQASAAAEQIKFPLVVKPTSTDRGVGVTVGIQNEEELKFAWSQASSYGAVLIEEMLEGFDYRLHVIDGKCIYAVKRMPPHVIGNGVDNLAELVESHRAKQATHPFYRRHPYPSLSDPSVVRLLESQKLSALSIIPVGNVVFLRSNANVSTGGVFEDVTAITHPENRLLAERAARIVGIDNAGIDFISTDIGKPWWESGGGICEINPTPMFFLDEAYKALLDSLFVRPFAGRIPLVLLLGEPYFLKDHCDLLISSFKKYCHTYGFIYDRRLNVFSANGVFVAPGKRTQNLLTGLLTDEFVEVAFIQISFEEIKAGLDLHYLDLLVAMGTESELSFIERSDLISRCKETNILTNPSKDRFQDAINELFKDAGSL